MLAKQAIFQLIYQPTESPLITTDIKTFPSPAWPSPAGICDSKLQTLKGFSIMLIQSAYARMTLTRRWTGMFGKNIRMERIMDRNTGNCVIVPMDHGISIGPTKGLVDVKETVNSVAEGGATAVIMHKGLIPYGHRTSGRDIGLILHLSASTDIGVTSNSKVLVATVEEALKLGADAVSVHINVGAETESQMLSDLGMVSKQCCEWGMPLLAMAYPRGPKIEDSYDPQAVAHAARVASELGADIVKCSYTGDIDSFREVVRGTLAPVLIAGGPKMDSDEEILQMVYDSMQAGGHGVSIGRNIFQNRNVKGMTKAVSDIVLRGYTPDEARRENLRRCP